MIKKIGTRVLFNAARDRIPNVENHWQRGRERSFLHPLCLNDEWKNGNESRDLDSRFSRTASKIRSIGSFFACACGSDGLGYCKGIHTVWLSHSLRCKHILNYPTGFSLYGEDSYIYINKVQLLLLGTTNTTTEHGLQVLTRASEVSRQHWTSPTRWKRTNHG